MCCCHRRRRDSWGDLLCIRHHRDNLQVIYRWQKRGFLCLSVFSFSTKQGHRSTIIVYQYLKTVSSINIVCLRQLLLKIFNNTFRHIRLLWEKRSVKNARYLYEETLKPKNIYSYMTIFMYNIFHWRKICLLTWYIFNKYTFNNTCIQ